MKLTYWKAALYILLFLTLGTSLFFLSSYLHPASAKCPDDYGNDDAGSVAYLADFDRWTNDFFDLKPDATLTQWAQARHQFWLDNDCKAALQRYEDAKAGKADPATMRLISNVIDEAIASSTR